MVERFYKNWCQHGIFRASRGKIDPKIVIFCQVDTRDLEILVVQKIVFWTFPKLLWSCLGSVWALFSALIEPPLGVFSTRNVDKGPHKTKLSA